MKLKLSKPSFLAACSLFTTKEHFSNPLLENVHIEPHPEKGVLLVATDGYRLIVFYDREGSIDCEYVNFLVTDKIFKASKYNSKLTPIELRCDGSSVEIKYSDNTLEDFSFVKNKNEYHTFPDWRRPIPTGENCVFPHVFWFDPNQIADYKKVMQVAYGDNLNTLIQIEYFNEYEKNIIRSAYDDWFSVLMRVKHPFLDEPPFKV